MEQERSLAVKPLPSGRDDPEAVGVSLIDSLVGYNLRRAAARQRERFRNVFSPYDIRPVQLTALTIILHNDSLTQSALGKAMDIKRANVVKLLDELQQRGLIERRPSTRDRRAYELRLTPTGKKLTRELLAIHQKLEANLALSLGCDELKQLVKLLRKFRSVDPAPDLP
jgi:DNA-binding MarR family transcriptional regulator